MRRFSACLSRLLPSWLFHALCPRLISSDGRHTATPQLLHRTSAGLPCHLTLFSYLAYFPKVVAAAAVSRCWLTCVWHSLCDSCKQQCAQWQKKKNLDRLTADVSNRDEYLKIIVLWICLVWISKKTKRFYGFFPFHQCFVSSFFQLGL